MITQKRAIVFLASVFMSTTAAMDKEDFLRNVAIGGAAGATEVTANQWLIGLKNRAQQGQPFTLNPKTLYKGYGIA